MRLIDADKLHYIRKWFEDSNKSEVVVFARGIDKAPTVKAIPVEWIAEWVTTHDEFSWSRMLHDWREERKEK